jgi:hypothetical protein
MFGKKDKERKEREERNVCVCVYLKKIKRGQDRKD